VAKLSVGKPSRGGRKWAVRQLDSHGTAVAERVSVEPPDPSAGGRVLLQPLVRQGEIVGRRTLEQARQHHRDSLAELPVHALQLSRGYPAIPTVMDADDHG
jgi:nicotinate phosphoribosyltransferase